MYRVRALLMIIALAATACSGDSDTAAEVESPTTTETTEAEAPTSTETTGAEAPTTTEAAEIGGESIVIESDVDFATAIGTFTVDEGAELLGCSSGSLAQRGGPQGPHGVTNTFICEDGDRQGTFTFAWKIIDGAKGPGTDNGLWSVLATTGDFAGLTGDGLGSGVVDGDTATMSFPGAIEYGAVGAAAEPDPAIVTDLTAYVVAFFTDDTEGAWNGVSERCQEILDSETHDGWVAELTLAAPGATVTDIGTVIDGDTAAVTYYVFDDAGTLYSPYLAQPWIFSDGNWHQDNC